MYVSLRTLAAPTVNLGELQLLDPDRPAQSDDDERKAWGTFVLLEPIEFAVDGELFTVPAGFMTDFASVPRMLWWLYPSRGRRYELAAVIHDWLYSTAAGLDRARSDRVFRVAMLALGVPAFRAAILWAAVRFGGRKAWETGQANAADDPTWRILE